MGLVCVLVPASRYSRRSAHRLRIEGVQLDSRFEGSVRFYFAGGIAPALPKVPP